MPAQGVTLQAAFEEIPDYTVTATAQGNGTVTVETAGVMDGENAVITMEPQAENDCRQCFGKWSAMACAFPKQ